ncbi:MAG TPA: AAA family ATPase [Planctomycetaceae bacterium]|jgi:predicted ATPase|nr:AAA family ATPase [Planctomycetaceae bacterium]
MGTPLKTLTIQGFKSIESLEEFPLDSLNVLIGANGAGKSNFVDFFRLLRALADEAFQSYVNEQGGGDGLLFLGPKVTPKMSAHLEFGMNQYEFDLAPTASGTLQIQQERVKCTGDGSFEDLSYGAMESSLKRQRNAGNRQHDSPGVSHYVYEAVSNWTVYHFHDTSPLSPMRRDQPLRDWDRFRHDASNIAPFLAHLEQEEPDAYALIRDTVRLIAPFFDDFLLRPVKRGSEEQVRLEWRQKGTDFPFQPNHLSDGTMRFICLATALLQPNPPATIVIDEPELGLHPYAISMLADLINSASERTQVILSTQSPTLLDYFEPEQIVVVSRQEGRSTFERLDPQALAGWLEDYSVGELWQKNVVRGGPSRA